MRLGGWKGWGGCELGEGGCDVWEEGERQVGEGERRQWREGFWVGGRRARRAGVPQVYFIFLWICLSFFLILLHVEKKISIDTRQKKIAIDCSIYFLVKIANYDNLPFSFVSSA